MVRRILLAAGVAVLLLLGYVLVVRQPSNDRDWEFGMTTLPSVTFAGDNVTIRITKPLRKPHMTLAMFEKIDEKTKAVEAQ